MELENRAGKPSISNWNNIIIIIIIIKTISDFPRIRFKLKADSFITTPRKKCIKNLVGVLKYPPLPGLVDFPAEEDPVRSDPASREERSSFVDFQQLGNDRVLHWNSLLHHSKELAVSGKDFNI